MKTSLWEHNGRIKVFGGGLLGDEGDLNIWLDELVEKRQVIRVDLRIPVFSGRRSDMELKVYNLGLPRDGARIFWELKRVAEFVARNMADKAEWLRKGLRRSWVPGLVTQYCVPQAHFVSGHSGVKGGIGLTGAFASQCSCSTLAMLSLLAWWSTHSKYEDMVKCSLSILEGFARRLPTKVALPIEFVQEGGEGGPMLVTYQAEVEGGILGLARNCSRWRGILCEPCQ